LAKHDEKAKKIIKEANSRGMRDVSPDPITSIDKGKGKETSHSDSGSDGDGSSLLPANAEGEEHRAQRMPMTIRIREIQVVLHRIGFCLGDLYHTLGKENEERENYEAAETQRRSLLNCTFLWLIIVSITLLTAIIVA